MAHSRLYVRIMNSKEWRRVRNLYLGEHPLCEMCKAEGYYRPARCVHHRQEVESGRTEKECWEIATRTANLQALCYDCHAKVHRQQRSHSRESHHQREQERLRQWISRHVGDDTITRKERDDNNHN